MKILLLGANGQLGKELRKQLSNEKNVFAFTREELDINNYQDVTKIINIIMPNIIINAAAFTNVEGAENDKGIAFSTNGYAVKHLALETKRIKAWLIHYSTDYVFDGKKSSPYTETDKPNPINNYGMSKYIGEQAIQSSLCSYIIFRTSWVIGQYGTNFVTKIIDKILNGHQLKVVIDQVGTPTTSKLISKVTLEFIELIKNEKPQLNGTYNLTANESTSWYNFAESIYSSIYDSGFIEKKHMIIQPSMSSELKQKAKRPLNSILDNKKLSKHLSFGLPHWKDAFYEEFKPMLDELEKKS